MNDDKKLFLNLVKQMYNVTPDKESGGRKLQLGDKLDPSSKRFLRDIRTPNRPLQSRLAKYLVPSTGNPKIDDAITSNPVKLLRGSFREGMKVPELSEIPSRAMILTEQLAASILEGKDSSQESPNQQEAKSSLNKLLFLDDISRKTVESNLRRAIADYDKAMLPIQNSLKHNELASAALYIAMHNAHLFIVVESLKHVPNVLNMKN